MSSTESSFNGYLFAGSSNIEFAHRVAKQLGTKLSDMICSKFSNGEPSIQIGQNVRKKNCYIIQTTDISSEGSPNDNFMEMMTIVDALQRADASTITLVIPCFGYQRQDRKDYSRAPITSSMAAKLIECYNISRIIFMDLHAGQIQGFFYKTPVDNLYAENDLIEYIEDNIISKYGSDNVLIVSPDEGGIKRATRISKKLDLGFVMISKNRKKANQITSDDMMIISSNDDGIKDKVVVIVDDMIDTAGTACSAAKVLKSYGASKVYMIVAHLILSGKAIERIENSDFEEVIGTNTLEPRFHREDIYESKKNIIRSKNSKIVIIDVSWIFAEAINRGLTGESLSIMYRERLPRKCIEPFYPQIPNS